MGNHWEYVFSAILLLALVSIYEFITSSVHFDSKRQEELLSGLGVGIVTIVLLNNPVNISEGIFVDSRWVWLSCCAIFLNWRIVVIGGIIAAAYRYVQGGAGAFPGVMTVVTSIAIGFLWRWILVLKRWKFKWYLHYIFAFSLEVAILIVLYTFMPFNKGPMVVSAVLGPLLVVFPVLSTILSLLMQHHYQKGVAGFR